MSSENSTVDIFNNSTETELQVASKEETVALIAYLLCCLLAVFVGNGIVFSAVFKKRELHTQHFFVLFSYALCDIVICIAMYPLAIMILLQGSNVSEWFCRASSCLGISAFSSAMYFLALLAYERYHFFCRPLSYETFFTRSKLSCMVAAAWIIPLAYFITNEVLIGRKVYPLSLGCRMDSSKIMLQVNIWAFVAPSLFVISWSLICVGRTWAKIRAKSAPQVVQQNNTTETYLPVEGLSSTYRAKAAKLVAAAKLIIMVSGLFWATLMPGFIARTVIFSGGTTWDEVESRRNRAEILMLRCRDVLSGSVSQVLNPLLYLYTHPELRAAVNRLFRRSSS